MISLGTASMIKKTAFLFFFILGLLHFTAFGLSQKQILLPFSEVTAKILYIPFLASSLAYAYGILKEHLLFHGRGGKTLDFVFASVGIVAVVGLLIVQFIFPDI